MASIKYNEPGAPTNPPQHSLDGQRLPPGGDVDRGTWKHRPTGEGTAPPERDVADPHPSDEEHYGRIHHPGGVHAPNESRDIGRNSWAHDGTPGPRPRNAETD